jgi:hypothetical protein
MIDLSEFVCSDDEAGSPMIVKPGPVGGKRKRIVDSDEESDKAPPPAGDGGGMWLEKKAPGSGLIRKKGRAPGRAASVDSLFSLPAQSPSAGSIKGNNVSSPDLFVLGDTPERKGKAPDVFRIKNMANVGRQDRKDRNDKRNQPQAQKVKKSKPSSKRREAESSSSGESEGSSSSGDSSGGESIDANEWDNDVTANAQVKERVRHILATCGKLSTQLRKAMTKWGVSSSADSNCVNLAEISGAGEGDGDGEGVAEDDELKLLRQADFENMCPDLVLKDYQTVGVNWMRLLHENRVNGVLADDMVCYMIYALCYMIYALCYMIYALCYMIYAIYYMLFDI